MGDEGELNVKYDFPLNKYLQNVVHLQSNWYVSSINNISFVNSCLEKGFNLCFLTYVCEMALPEGVASSLSLLRFLSSLRGVCTIGGILMVGCFREN